MGYGIDLFAAFRKGLPRPSRSPSCGRIPRNAKRRDSLMLGQPFGSATRIPALPAGKKHKPRGVLRSPSLLGRLVHPLSKRHIAPNISHAHPWVTAPRRSRIVFFDNVCSWPVQVVLVRVLSQSLQSTVVVMADVNVGLP